jgi:hypothetical protein
MPRPHWRGSTKAKTKTKQNKTKTKYNKNIINNIGGNVTASAPADSYACAAATAASV